MIKYFLFIILVLLISSIVNAEYRVYVGASDDGKPQAGLKATIRWDHDDFISFDVASMGISNTFAAKKGDIFDIKPFGIRFSTEIQMYPFYWKHYCTHQIDGLSEQELINKYKTLNKTYIGLLLSY